jgi:large subunit ribosomal protein L21
MDVYAIIRDRGMQYRVEKGQVVNIDLLDVEPGSQIELSEVLLIGDGEAVQVGAPLVSGAVVKAEVLGVKKGEKVVVFRYRNKKRYRRRTGHRQRYTEIKISDIVA